MANPVDLAEVAYLAAFKPGDMTSARPLSECPEWSQAMWARVAAACEAAVMTVLTDAEGGKA